MLAHKVEKVRVAVGVVAAFGPSALAVEDGASCSMFRQQRRISIQPSSQRSWFWAPSVETWGRRKAVDEDGDSCVAITVVTRLEEKK